MEHHQQLVITCARGMVSVLSAELQREGLPVTAASENTVETQATWRQVQRLNLVLRTAHRILYPVARFQAGRLDEFFASARQHPWEELIPETGYLCVTSTVDTPTIRDIRVVALKAKDAIVDRLREQRGVRPDSGPDRTGVVIHVYWKERDVTLFLDTSGEPLSRRGYRKNPWKAPMQETLAAGCALISGWDGETPFVNPMCGSGTIAIEAALIGLNRAPGLQRSNFGFMHSHLFRREEWNEVRNEVAAAARTSLPARILASDLDPQALVAARANAHDAGVENCIDFSVADFRTLSVPPPPGVVMMNPEYGERLGDIEALAATYKEIGDFLKKSCTGYKAYVFTGNLDLAKKVGLRSSRRIILFNSQIECRLLEFEMYAGTKNP